MRKNGIKKTKIITIILLFNITFIPIIPISIDGTNYPQPFFSISILAPNTTEYSWVTILQEQLPKIGIKIETINFTGWKQIKDRTYGHPGPYPIPVFSEGGFDILCTDWDWRLDVDMKGLFDTPSIPPNGDNIYQYSRPEMDWAVGNYSQSFVLADRINYANDIQALLYEDVPQATIYYPDDVIPHNSSLISSSWSPLLWENDFQDMANWEIPGQTEFRYAVPFRFKYFHPFFNGVINDSVWSSQIYSGMTERKSEAPYISAYAPYLATSYSSADGYTYEVQLNPNAVFADGTKCNASDIEYTFDNFYSVYWSLFYDGFWQMWFDSESIVINSEFDITINFLQNDNFIENFLSIDILPKHIWSSIDPYDHVYQAGLWALNDTLDSNLFGIGPYYLFDCGNNNETIHLKANPHWTDWGGHTAQKFTDLYFHYYPDKESALTALAVGDVDMVDSSFNVQLDEIPETANYTIVTSLKTTELAFNNLHPYLGTGELCPISSPDSGKYVRKAISHVLPRDYIIAENLDGLGRKGVTAWPKGTLGYDDSLEPYEYSIELALSYMELAGFDVYESNIGNSSNLGLGLLSILGFFASLGGSVIIINTKRRFRN